MTYYIDEIIDEANNKSTPKERVEYLKQFSNRTVLRELLRISYDNRVKVLMPETEPPYTPSDAPRGMEDKRIDNELRRFKILIQGGGYDNITQVKRESVFLDILNSLYKDEAHYVQLAFRKKLRIKGLSVKHINEIFGLSIPEPEPKKKKKKEKETKETEESNQDG